MPDKVNITYFQVYAGELSISPNTPTPTLTTEEVSIVHKNSSSHDDEEVSRVLALEKLLEERLNTKLPVT